MTARRTHHTGTPTGSPPKSETEQPNGGAGGGGYLLDRSQKVWEREIPTKKRRLPESDALPPSSPLQESRRIGSSSSWKFLTETLSVVDSESQTAGSGLEKSGLGLGEMACVGDGVYIGGDRRALGEKLRACFCHGCSCVH
jgi:hypothetical protein